MRHLAPLCSGLLVLLGLSGQGSTALAQTDGDKPPPETTASEAEASPEGKAEQAKDARDDGSAPSLEQTEQAGGEGSTEPGAPGARSKDDDAAPRIGAEPPSERNLEASAASADEAELTSIEKEELLGAETEEGESLEAMLAQMEREESGLSGEISAVTRDTNLQFYGFADFSLSHFFIPETSAWRLQFQDLPTFSVGNFNLYMDAQIAKNWRSLGEVRFSYLPNGSRSFQGADVVRESTVTADYTVIGQNRRYGGIFIERLWVEHTFSSLLSIRAGNWLTPYSNWNVDHGTPTIMTVVTPFTLNLKGFPNRQSGVLLSGGFDLTDSWQLNYNLGLANGSGPIEEYRDLDANKAVTVRVEAERLGHSQLKAGATGYYGRNTDLQQVISAGGGGLAIDDDIQSESDELAYGFDLRWQHPDFLLQWELAGYQRRFTDRGRPVRSTGEVFPDEWYVATYAMFGYHTGWFGVTPFVGTELITFANDNEVNRGQDQDAVWVLQGGFNIKPAPTVTIKLEYAQADFLNVPPDSASVDTLRGLQSQIAWAF